MGLTLEDGEKFADMLSYAAECIKFCQRAILSHDCNDCGAIKECQYAPGWGEQTRINCPLWKEETT